MFDFLKKIFGTAQDRTIHRFSKIVEEVNRWDLAMSSLSDDDLKKKTEEFRRCWSSTLHWFRRSKRSGWFVNDPRYD